MFVICYQLKNLVGHLVETKVLLNHLRLNMFTYFFIKRTYIHYRRQLNQKLETIQSMAPILAESTSLSRFP